MNPQENWKTANKNYCAFDLFETLAQSSSDKLFIFLK